MSTPGRADRGRAGRALTAVGAVLSAVAVPVFALCVWLVAGPVGLLRAGDGPPSSVPAQVPLDASRTEYLVYARSAGVGPPPGWRDVRVVSAAGVVVGTSPDTGHVLGHDAEEFRSIARFAPPSDGRYTVEVGGTPGTEVQVVPQVSDDAIVRLGIGVVGLVASLALALFGLTLLVVGLVRRSRAESQHGMVLG